MTELGHALSGLQPDERAFITHTATHRMRRAERPEWRRVWKLIAEASAETP